MEVSLVALGKISGDYRHKRMENSKKVVLDQRFEAMVTKAMDVSDELQTDGKISGIMEKHLTLLFPLAFGSSRSLEHNTTRLNLPSVHSSPRYAKIGVMFLSRFFGRTLFAAKSETSASAASSSVRTEYNPFAEFFEVYRSVEDDKHVVYGTCPFYFN
ncbi:hypothetical protein TorRG33x02_108890 [Trema orientale]|uniref:Uncharacterized protein n=1 Tax=Trema orientale TaxID=63057 RepID=A0A2P5F697_TREOI|nr:hypothetical protein TorRG33x02_108890 [Trema orientale]